MTLGSVGIVGVMLLHAIIIAVCAATSAHELPEPPGLSEDRSVWPNRESRRNSDDWLSLHHDAIRQMRPRVLVLNFANDVSAEEIRRHAESVIAAMAEATRHPGYDDPEAASFLRYELLGVVDLRDADAKERPARTTSSLMPRKADRRPGEPLVDYTALLSDAFAPHLGCADPREPGRFLSIRELVDAGWLHELWFYAIHDPGDAWPGLETCEFKRFYDADARPIPDRFGPAGNGHDRTMPWLGRSFRVAFFNPHRGPGCAMENFGHAMEWIANSGSNLYFKRYFDEFADFDLRSRGLPIDSFYRTSYDRSSGDRIEFPKPDRIELTVGGERIAVEPFMLRGGSVHFPPGARWHYDLASPATVLSTLETWRQRVSPADSDEPRPFHRDCFARNATVAPDCMGPWVVHWFQSMPGLDNRSIDDDGRPMRNWWPFLFY